MRRLPPKRGGIVVRFASQSSLCDDHTIDRCRNRNHTARNGVRSVRRRGKNLVNQGQQGVIVGKSYLMMLSLARPVFRSFVISVVGRWLDGACPHMTSLGVL